MRRQKMILPTSLLIATLASCLLYNLDKKQAFAGVKVEQLQEMVDWNRDVNFEEAKKNLRLAKEINQEKRRRKQLKDAGISEEEITKIIQNERLARANGGKIPLSQDKQSIIDKESNENDENNDNDEENESVWLTDKPSKKAKKQSKDSDEVIINGEKMPSGSNAEIIKNQQQATKQQNIDNQQASNVEAQDYENDYENNKNNNNNYAFTKETNYDYVLHQKPLDSNSKQRDAIYNDIEGLSEQSYDDFELSRMLKKAGENANNPQNFAVFAKEVAKIANKQNTTNNSDVEVEIPQMNYDNEDELFANSTINRKQYKLNGKHNNKKNNSKMYANHWVRYGGKNTNKGNTNTNNANIYKRLGNMYATAIDDINNKNNNNANDNSRKKLPKNQKNRSQKGNNYTNNSNKKNNNIGMKNKRNNKELYSYSDNEEMETATNEDEEIVLGKSYMTEKQAKAKQNGAPHPYRRESTDKRTQYQPQNIAQIAYDDNNKHLKPAVFESHVINQVFDNLGDPNAVQIARALINKVGETDIRDEDGNTLLMHAVARKNQSLIAMLLAEGASPNAMNNEGFAPIHLASSNGDDTAIHSLMMSGANPNLKDKDGNTSLMYASKMGNANSVKLMMSLGGDPTITNLSTGKTAFDFANENENPIISTLLDARTKKILRKRHPVELTR